jgi:hypothetical protein
LLFLSGEISMGVPGCPTRVLVGWEGTAAVARSLLAMEKSAEAVVPAGIGLVAGKGQTQSRGEGRPCSWESR